MGCVPHTNGIVSDFVYYLGEIYVDRVRARTEKVGALVYNITTFLFTRDTIGHAFVILSFQFCHPAPIGAQLMWRRIVKYE